jgi:uncharacterized protein with ParB-like and HNH nuclease domain
VASDLLETSTITWGELVGNGRRLVVPPFQRNYAWGLPEWEDLWSDLKELRRPEARNHYMGSVVLQQTDERTYILIDGQQRLTTLSLLALAVLAHLYRLQQDGVDAQANHERAILLETQFLGAKNPASLVHSWKLRLNRQCNGFYQNYLLPRALPSTRKNLTHPELLLWDAYRFFESRLGELSLDGQALAEFLNDVVSLKILFLQVIVQDEVSAYSLIARGVELTATDLIKNYLFSVVANTTENTDYIEERWSKLEGIIGARTLPEFVRHYFNSIGPLVRSFE